jgi:hypothetical protein
MPSSDDFDCWLGTPNGTQADLLDKAKFRNAIYCTVAVKRI